MVAVAVSVNVEDGVSEAVLLGSGVCVGAAVGVAVLDGVNVNV